MRKYSLQELEKLNGYLLVDFYTESVLALRSFVAGSVCSDEYDELKQRVLTTKQLIVSRMSEELRYMKELKELSGS